MMFLMTLKIPINHWLQLPIQSLHNNPSHLWTSHKTTSTFNHWLHQTHVLQGTNKPLPPSPYHLQPPTYYSQSIITPVPSHLPSINNDFMSQTALTRALALTPFNYLRHVLQQVHDSLWHHRKPRHKSFMHDSSYFLTIPFLATKMTNCCCHILVELNNGCLFPEAYYGPPSTHGSDRSHIMKMDSHCQQLVDRMPSNRLPQVTLGFPPPCQLGCTFPCYVFILFHGTFFTLSYYVLCPICCTYDFPGMWWFFSDPNYAPLPLYCPQTL